jgi:hypothetical protein
MRGLELHGFADLKDLALVTRHFAMLQHPSTLPNLQSKIYNLQCEMVPPAGLEPATPGLGIRCSIH